jgi:hypothetical protein
MTIAEILKVLNSSFKNGLYIRRPHFEQLDIVLYINKNGKTWQLIDGHVYEVELMQLELNISDWEIVT